MKKTTKLLAIVLVLTMLIGIIPMSALAYDIGVDDIVTDDPDGVTFATPLEVGVKYEGEIQSDDPFVEVGLREEEWVGYAKSFTVTLDGYTDYTVKAHVEGEDAVYVDRAIAVYYERELVPYVTDWVDSNSIDVSVTFESYLPGEYQILVWGFCCDENDADLFDSTYVSVLIDEAEKIAYSEITYDTKIQKGESVEITLEADDPYFEEFGYYGNGFGFTTDFTQGKYYLVTVEVTINEDIATHDIDPSLAIMENKDGELTNFNGGYDTLSYIVRADRTGEYKFLFLAETYDHTDGKYIYGDLVFYNISVDEVAPTYFDIDCEEDYIEFIDDLYARNYEGSIVVATIYGDLDFTDNEYCYGIETNASALFIEGIGETVIEGIPEALVDYCEYVYIENITVKADLSYVDDSKSNLGLLVGYAIKADINNCNAYGSITFTDCAYAEDIGGLIGDVGALNVNDTEVKVDITFDGTDVICYVGGICGYNGSINASNVSYCGDIIADAPDEFYYIGGFVGETYNDGVYENCTVEGNIKYNGNPTTTEFDVRNIGGFAGYIEDYNVFNNCNVTGDIYVVYGDYVGGFVGYLDEANAFFNCYADGDVTGYNYVGGFAGISDCCGVNMFANCYTVGMVNGKDVIGGFIGGTYYEDTFINCYAYGKVICSESDTTDLYIGTFAGYVEYDTVIEGVHVQNSEVFATIGYCADEEKTYSYLYSVNFKDTEDVAFVVDMLNGVADEANEMGIFDYKLLNWSADNEDGIPKFAEKPAYIVGDANLDGKVDSVDYLLVKRHCFKTYTLEGDALKAANINGDGKIDSTDYLLVKRICFGTYKV